MITSLKKIYYKTPVSFQNLLLSLYGWKLDSERYGAQFKHFQELMLRFETSTKEEISEYQDESLRKLIEHAFYTVPYYNNLFKRKKLKPSDIKSYQDLEKLPFLTKDMIKQNFQDLISRDYNRKALFDGHTSGTTGKPLEVLYDQKMMGATYSALDRPYKWIRRSESRLEQVMF